MKNTMIYQQYREKIYRHILRLIRNPQEAEDLTQETFLRGHVHSGTLQNPDAEAAWLHRIATNLCYDHFRKSSYKVSKAATVLDENDPKEISLHETKDSALGLDQLVERAEMSACVQEFMRNLPPEYSRVLLLHDLLSFSSPEIASILNCSLETIKIRLHRARRRLKETLSSGCHFSYDKRGVFVCDRKAEPSLRQIQPEPL